MPTSIRSEAVRSALASAATSQSRQVTIGNQTVSINTPFPSPPDWRDTWIYFLLLDRFNNPVAPPRLSPFDGLHGVFQGGTFNGVREQLDYLQELGVGAIWLSPVIKNCQYEDTTYHGYGFQDFLQVEPRFSSDPQVARINPALAEDELRALIDAAHARGIYIIFDIVLNHAGNVFGYVVNGSDNAPSADGRNSVYPVRWHDAQGNAAFADFSGAPVPIPDDAAVWPVELQRNELFRRKGKGGEAGGDFESLKELVTDFSETDSLGRSFPVHETLILAYQYMIAKFDVDGYRIDTLKFIEPDFARIFANAMREFALSIGKKNFFTFGEVFDEEEKINQFIGRTTSQGNEPIGVDAALDFPLFFRLPSVAKGLTPPSSVQAMYRRRKDVQRDILSTHGDATNFFVTFLDNHDMKQRFYYRDAADPTRFDAQATLGLACLFTLQGIPCVYYGTEQGLHGLGNSDAAVREALWGKPNAFDPQHSFYAAIKAISAVRNEQPALRYGRQYFRPISGDGVNFGISPFSPGVLAFSRILNDQEVLIVANTQTNGGFNGEVIIDVSLNPDQAPFDILFSNQSQPQSPGQVVTKSGGSVTIHETDGSQTHGPVRVVPVQLHPMEVQILRRRKP
ncbi:alpha-amylase [Spirosoma taeanense]|uniref:Alpha-amylase n=1 Tax=Spirosoma taeanense TaxID=2735870 RepID=A0A6M5Y8Y5_9BACT|nr:alpha-amylase family glycosyl hydrolase [Spirosoma taeanense]QJW90445.1 alpha-amylase [Spirosoma taeanense]